MLKLYPMKKAFVSFGLIIFAASFISGCASPQAGSPAAIYEKEQKKEEARVEATQQTVVEIPSWYLNLPQDEHSEWFRTDWDKIGKYHDRLFQDEYGAKYSWAAVMALILSNFHYLHE